LLLVVGNYKLGSISSSNSVFPYQVSSKSINCFKSWKWGTDPQVHTRTTRRSRKPDFLPFRKERRPRSGLSQLYMK